MKWPDATERELQDGIRIGDHAAMEEVYRRYNHVFVKAAKWATSHAPDRHYIDDIVQEIFIAVLAAIPLWNGSGTLLAFVSAVSFNVAKKCAIQRREDRTVLKGVHDLDAHSDGRTPPPDEAIEKVSETESVLACLETLPRQERELIRLCYNEGLSIKDAGASIGLPRSTAYRIFGSAIGELRACMEQKGWEVRKKQEKK